MTRICILLEEEEEDVDEELFMKLKEQFSLIYLHRISPPALVHL